MTQAAQTPHLVRFESFEVDLLTGELRRNAQRVKLPEQSFQILAMLLEKPGDVVMRQEIQNRLWPNDTVVEYENSINAAVKNLRLALGDSADQPRYIETLPRRGYRFITPIREISREGEAYEPAPRSHGGEGSGPGGAYSRMRPLRRIARLVLACTVVVVGAGYLSWRHFRSPAIPKAEKIMLAVLPFENLTGDPNKEYLADGLTEQTISFLGRLNPERLGVIARTSVMGYKHKDERLDQIGRDLSVQYVLENSLRESGDHLRLTAQLIQVKDQTHLWSGDYDYPAKDILNIEDDVAKSVAREIQLRLTSQKQADLAQSRPVNPEAFDAYLQGYYFFELNTDKDTDVAAKYFERATQIDPSYALAWVGLSRARNWQANEGLIPAEEAHRLAREAVERALALNPDLAAAHAQLGRIERQVDFNWAGADASFQRMIALEPGNPENIELAAEWAASLGRFDEALQLGRRGVDLDPLNADGWESLAETEFFNGQLDEAASDAKKALELKPDLWFSHFFLSQIYIFQGRPQDALPEIALVRSDGSCAFLYSIAYHALGRQRESDVALNRLIEKYHTFMTYQVADVYAFRNQSDKAFEWLDRAYVQRDSGLIDTRVDPLLKNLHSDPRFAAFLKKLNLPD